MSLFGTPSSSGQPNNNTTTSSAPAGGGLFGSSTTPATSSGGIFGAQAKTTPTFSFGNVAGGANSATPASSATPTGSLFGSAAKPGEQKPLFGAASSAAPGASTPSLGGGSGGGLFGGSSLTPSSTSMFASKPATTPTATGTSLFGNTPSAPNATATSTTPTTATAPAGKIFGQDSPAVNNLGGAAANKPGGLFGGGSGATGASLFGNTSSNTTSTTQATPAKPMFSLNSTTPAGAPPANTSKPPGGVSIFGATTTTTAPSGSPLFSPAQQGEKRENQTPSLFANQASSQPKPATTQPAPSLFPAASQTQKPPTSLFNATKPAEPSSMFGTKTATTESGGSAAAGLSSPSPFGQLGQSKPAETAAPAAKPASLFGNVAAPTSSGASPFLTSASTTQTPSTSTPAPAATQTPSIFGNANKPAASATPTEAPKLQFGKPAASSATSETPKPLSLFGATPASTATPSTTPAAAPITTTTSATSATAAAPAAGSLFGNANKGAAPAESTATKPTTSQTATLGASTSGPTSSMARLKNRTMDEILNRWATDLSKYQKEFKEQASQVAAWDRLLVENGDKIQRLYLNTFEAEKASREVERHLVNVESQQDELESWLDKYEADVDALFSKQFGSGDQLTGPDQERERTYKLAEKITERLDEMGRDLTKMIKEINDISGTVSKGTKPDDPLSQIVRVLNGHLTQLQWIDTNAAALQAKVAAAQKASSQIGNQYGGPEQDNVDSFRYYMGRR
ncbi:hypothetical protein ONZ43_g3153 [Nemania bipapillata]|uniref:Uncharacterized protein n=1 Tax=Nemania bipapillata TaxID=110536 RepID=A0ACC2IXT2_9PEZI|nr:hypothetical protein ONZ43_g3153 [Nemania bipapillata]